MRVVVDLPFVPVTMTEEKGRASSARNFGRCAERPLRPIHASGSSAEGPGGESGRQRRPRWPRASAPTGDAVNSSWPKVNACGAILASVERSAVSSWTRPGPSWAAHHPTRHAENTSPASKVLHTIPTLPTTCRCDRVNTTQRLIRGVHPAASATLSLYNLRIFNEKHDPNTNSQVSAHFEKTVSR